MKLLVVAIYILLLCLNTQAQQVVTILWDDSTHVEVVGYKVYYGVDEGQYTQVVDVGDITFAEIAVTGATWFAITAYDVNGLESGYSEAARYVPPANTIYISGISAVTLTNGVSHGFSTNRVSGFLVEFLIQKAGQPKKITRGSGFVEDEGMGIIVVKATPEFNTVQKSLAPLLTESRSMSTVNISPVSALKRFPVIEQTSGSRKGKL